MPAPQRQKQSSQGIAQPSQKLISPQKIIGGIADQIKNLPAVNFTLVNNNSPISLPGTCAQILHQEKLLDLNGEVVYETLPKLHQEDFLRSLQVKLTYAIIQSRWREHLFQVADLIGSTQKEKYRELLSGFNNLFADYYSYFPTNIFLESRFVHLISPRLSLQRRSHQDAMINSKKFLDSQLIKDGQGLISSALFFLKTADPTTPRNTGESLIDRIVADVKTGEIIINDFNVDIDSTSFPQIGLSYPLSEETKL